MSRQLPSSLIAVSLSTRMTMMPASIAQHFAEVAGVDGVDIDATSTVGAWFSGRLRKPERSYLPVRTVWLPADDFHSQRSRRVMQAVMEHHSDSPPLVVALLSSASTLRDLTRNFEPGRVVSEPWRIALGLPSSALRGGRPHLVHLGGIRRFAEEWGFSIAIDLSGRFDPTWEAEAAVARLGDRLSVLRVSAAAPSRAAVGRDRVACRALHAAIDRDQELDIAVTPVKAVPFPITPRVASFGARRAADYITERTAIHAAALREGIGRYEGSPTSFGN